MPKKAFSGKQKKAQLQAKKGQKFGALPKNENERDERTTVVHFAGPSNPSQDGGAMKLENSKFFDNKIIPSRMNPGKYALTFRVESKEEVFRLKEQARQTIRHVDEEYLECGSEEFYNSKLDFPIRPPWNYKLGREELEKNENRYFQNYLMLIDQNFERNDLSYFEMNLETWRQFWRVLEMSDILLCVVDIRYPPLLFPPALYNYVSKVGKQIILVLNKCDMSPAPLIIAWTDYFKKTYEGLEVICFTSYPSYNLYGNVAANGCLKRAKRVRGRVRMAAEGAMEVYKVCEKFVEAQVDLSKWKQKIVDEMRSAETEDDDEEEPELKIEKVESLKKQDAGYHEFTRFQGGTLTIGCVGQPNVGKSSLINALMGKKVVSVSKTPGHTKHFQTIFLTQNVRLCDCPGLIFPSKVPKALQVLSGSYPIAQLREPYSTVQYLAQRVDLTKLLGIQHPEGENDWSSYDIADGWALKRGYHTAKTSRLDSYRGANHILRLALEGRITLCLRPPGYTADKEMYNNDPRLKEIEAIQSVAGSTAAKEEKEIVVSESETDDEDDEDESNIVRNDEDKKPVANSNSQEEEDDVQPLHKSLPKTKTKNKFSILCQSGDETDED